MKKFSILLVAVAVSTVAVSAQAGLVSEWTFDGTATNAITAATGSVTAGGAAIVGTGKIGSGSLSLVDNNASYFDAGVTDLPSPTLYGDNSTGWWTGTYSFWAKVVSDTAGGMSFISHQNSTSGGFYITSPATDRLSGAIKRVSAGNPALSITGAGFALTPGTTLWDGGWHHIAMTWNLTTGASGATSNDGTGSITFFVDGVQETPPTLVRNSVDSNTNFGTQTKSFIGADVLTGSVNASFAGGIDYAASWDVRLSLAQGKALFNMGNDALNYNAAQVQGLFDIYTGTSSTYATTMAALGWSKYGTGTAFDGTGAFASNQLALGSAGGVVIPEPGTLSLLVAGAIGLLVFAWRRRK